MRSVLTRSGAVVEELADYGCLIRIDCIGAQQRHEGVTRQCCGRLTTMTHHHGHLHHVEIYVSDLHKSLAFWRWLLAELGYERSEAWDAGESWKLGETYLVFVQVGNDFTEPQYDRRRVGLNHLAFHVSSRSDIDRLAKEVTERGSRLLYGDRYPSNDYYAIYFEDPDGIKVELVGPTKPHHSPEA